MYVYAYMHTCVKIYAHLQLDGIQVCKSAFENGACVRFVAFVRIYIDVT